MTTTEKRAALLEEKAQIEAKNLDMIRVKKQLQLRLEELQDQEDAIKRNIRGLYQSIESNTERFLVLAEQLRKLNL